MLKGKTKIELFDAVTNKKVAEQEDQNMVTNAIKNIFGFGEEVLASGVNLTQYLNHFTPLYPNFLRGILLFDNIIPENANTIFAPPGVKCVGHAGATYAGTKPTRGTLNETETVLLDNGVRMVWDFATDKANGLIRSVSLTSALGGNVGWLTANEDIADSIFQTVQIGSTAGTAFGTPLLKQNYSSVGFLGELKRGTHTFVANPGGGKIEVIEQTFTNPRQISIYDKMGNLNNQHATEKVYTFEPGGNVVNASNCNNFLDENNILRNFSLTNNRDLRIISIDLNSKTLLAEKNVTLSENATLHQSFALYKNHIYCSQTNVGVRKFTSDGQFVEMVSTVASSYRMYRFDKYLYIRLDSGTTIVTDGDNHREIPSARMGGGASTSPSESFKPPIYINHTPVAVINGAPVFNYITPYLATINNISPVTKNNQNTMKVTYELTQN